MFGSQGKCGKPFSANTFVISMMEMSEDNFKTPQKPLFHNT